MRNLEINHNKSIPIQVISRYSYLIIKPLYPSSQPFACSILNLLRYTGDVGLVKDLDTGTYFYVVKDNAAQQETAQKENKYFHFTSEELNSEK